MSDATITGIMYGCGFILIALGIYYGATINRDELTNLEEDKENDSK